MLASSIMGRHLYSTLLLLCLPILITHVVRKYRRENQNPMVTERLGIKLPRTQEQSVWIHACSLGESKVGLKLARELVRLDPSIHIFMTATTPSGLNELSSSEFQSHVFPWDFSWIWSRWITHMKPKALIVIETELWPNLVSVCTRQQIPVFLANGRLSLKSMTGYQRFSWLTKPMWARITRALMQFEDDAHRAHALGVPAHAISEVGSIKLDQLPPQVNQQRAQQISEWKGNRQVVCLMSSHTQDDQVLVKWMVSQNTLGLIIVPRHPVRGDAIEVIARDAGLNVCRVSKGIESATQILIGDTFGDMGAYLSEADLVVIGGSFSQRGGQNPIEPALMSKPLIAGPSMYNFQAIASGLEEVGAMLVTDESHLDHSIQSALSHTHSMGQAANAWVEARRGSTERQAQAILAALADG